MAPIIADRRGPGRLSTINVGSRSHEARGRGHVGGDAAAGVAVAGVVEHPADRPARARGLGRSLRIRRPT